LHLPDSLDLLRSRFRYRQFDCRKIARFNSSNERTRTSLFPPKNKKVPLFE
jgi:hypothetical protein